VSIWDTIGQNEVGSTELNDPTTYEGKGLFGDVLIQVQYSYTVAVGEGKRSTSCANHCIPR
jgi:hypothetical protein